MEVEGLPSGCAILYYMVESQSFLGPQLVPDGERSASTIETVSSASARGGHRAYFLCTSVVPMAAALLDISKCQDPFTPRHSVASQTTLIFRCFCSPPHSDWLWGPHIFLFIGNGWRRLSPVVQRPRRQSVTHLCLVPMLKMRGATPPLSIKASWRGS